MIYIYTRVCLGRLGSFISDINERLFFGTGQFTFQEERPSERSGGFSLRRIIMKFIRVCKITNMVLTRRVKRTINMIAQWVRGIPPDFREDQSPFFVYLVKDCRQLICRQSFLCVKSSPGAEL